MSVENEKFLNLHYVQAHERKGKWLEVPCEVSPSPFPSSQLIVDYGELSPLDAPLPTMTITKEARIDNILTEAQKFGDRKLLGTESDANPQMPTPMNMPMSQMRHR